MKSRLHGLALYGKAFILLSVDFIPALELSLDYKGVNADEDVGGDRLARDEVTAVIFSSDSLKRRETGHFTDPWVWCRPLSLGVSPS